jgi:DNA ligase-1
MIPAGFKPNLAATLTKPELIKFPVWASPKIDGIRCVVFGGVAYSRSLKPIPNPFVQEWARSNGEVLEGVDGELIVGSQTDPNAMQNSMAVMSKKDEPDFTFHAFDLIDADSEGIPFEQRSGRLEEWVGQTTGVFPVERTKLVPQHLVSNAEELATLEAQFLEQGYEGLMIRSPQGMYKYGRSTEREGGLVKVKRFVDAEARVIDCVEEMHNANEAKRDALGNTERSTAKDGLVGKGTLGALVVERNGVTFNIGTGFTAAQRAELWQTYKDDLDSPRDHWELLGRLVTFKHFDHGTVDAPRHPVFKSFRHIEDT